MARRKTVNSRRPQAAPKRRRAPRRPARATTQTAPTPRAPAPPRARRGNISPAQAAPRGAAGIGFTPHMRMTDVLTKQDGAMLEYLEMLCNPEADPVGVPVVLGQFELFTNKYRVEYFGEATASSAGVAHTCAAPDNWLDIDNNFGGGTQQFSSYVGGTQGNLIWYSPPGGATTSLPTGGSAAGANHAAIQTVLVGSDWDSATRMRCSSVNLEVWSDASKQTATGNVTIFVAENSELIQLGTLSAAQPSTIDALPQNVLKHEKYPLSGWETGQRAHTFLVPWDENCFAMDVMPAVGRATVPNVMIGAIGSGMAVGQPFAFKWVFTYESTAAATFQTNVAVRPTVHVDPAQMADSLPFAKGMRPTMGSTTQGQGKGVSAWYQGLPAGKRPAAIAAAKQPSLVDQFAPAAKKGLSWLAGKIPYVGGALSSGIDWLFS